MLIINQQIIWDYVRMKVANMNFNPYHVYEIRDKGTHYTAFLITNYPLYERTHGKSGSELLRIEKE